MAMFVKSDGRALWPANKAAHIQLEKLPRGVPMRVEPKQPRNGAQHRLFWAFATYVAEALNDGPTAKTWTAEDVLTHVKIATGHVELMMVTSRSSWAEWLIRLGAPKWLFQHKEIPVFIPCSISFAAMDGQAFSRFMDAAFRYVRDDLCQWIVDSPHWPDIADILRESTTLEQAA